MILMPFRLSVLNLYAKKQLQHVTIQMKASEQYFVPFYEVEQGIF